MNFKLKIYITTLFLAMVNGLNGQVNVVLVEPTVQKFIGEVSELDRSKYFNIHAPGKTPFLNHFIKNIT